MLAKTTLRTRSVKDPDREVRAQLSEADMLGVESENVCFRYRDGKTGELRTRNLRGADLLRLLLAHVVPRGFRLCRS